MFCVHCGTGNPVASAFCASCGAPLGTSAPAGSPAPVSPSYADLPPTIPRMPVARMAPAAAPAAPSAVASVPPPAVAYVPPPAVAPIAPPAATPQSFVLAAVGDRFLAVILDTILLAAGFTALGMWIAMRWGGATASGFALNGTPAIATIAATMLSGFLYYWLFEGLFGATLGKAILGVSVRKKDGAACGMAASLVRNLLRVVDGLGVYLVGFLVAIFSSSRQRVGDHAAQTIVVSRSVGKLARAALVLAWLVTCVGGFAAAYLIHRG